MPTVPDYLSNAFTSVELQTQVIDFFDKASGPYDQEWIEQLRRPMLHAKIVVIRQGHHFLL